MLIALALLNASPEIIVGVPLRTHDSIPVSDPELETMRGGVQLPNGLNVAIGIDIQTRIDGVLALHTIYSSEGPNAGIRVFSDGTTSPRTAPTNTAVTMGGDGAGPALVVARSPTGTTITPNTGGPATTVNLVSGPTSGWLDAAGQTQIFVDANGASVPTSSGTVSFARNDRGAAITLVAPNVAVQHLVGQATGAVIANTGNDRVIDTVSSINVNLVGLPSGLVGNVLMVNRMAAEAAGRR
ncbi:MAG: hypothetical protein EOO77_03385 [Oxalobacteraceae bacterium]|nr:MAG: hypothetical protein EOO77_03385 [Oxalobacteraceae bacterium]